MASLVLGAVGAAAGSALGSFSFYGLTVSGAYLGGALGVTLGTMIDGALMPPVQRSGPRLSDLSIQSSTEGRPIPKVYGRVRLAGQIIWASRFSETASTSGGKGLGARSVETTTYAYSVSFAVGLCAGPVTRIGRIWADGNLLDPASCTIRSHFGSETQSPDPLIVEIEGEANAPAYRGLCYVVFEDLALAAYGNRIPQLQFEIVHTLALDDADALENRLTAVALIPGAGEFCYAPDIVQEDDGLGTTAPLNAHNASGGSDWSASLDELQALAPHLTAASLVVGWFGDDLRAGICTVQPGVEESVRRTAPEVWSVDGTLRRDAYIVSRNEDRPAYGGTPSDDSVKAAIADLRRRNIAVTFYPFVFMDIASGNSRTDPYTGGRGQPAYPWRGRITVNPAPGANGSVDQTAAATDQVNAFFANGYRRMVLHYARLCAEAGGVEAFLIGSELRGLTTVRDGSGAYPAVAALKQLAADVRAVLPGVKIGYAADWSEFPPHQTGGDGLRFHLDPLWCDPNIDFLGIDNYLPLADWREGGADAREYPSPYDPDYLAANIRGGEYYDWYYASDADRTAGLRTPITDAMAKPWVWRAKDIWSWWSSPHYDRSSGNESATAWVPASKPIRFTELGCPAVDLGANQPNVFHDPKSSESAFPYFSRGVRDDLMQRRLLEAHLSFWRDPANNPVSPVYHEPMLDTARTCIWCWDARPYPYFPACTDVWGDGGNYATGHWLNGRLGAVPLALLVKTLCDEVGLTAYDVSALTGTITGFAVTDTMSVREALAALMAAYAFDAVESEGVLRFVPRGSAPPLGIGEDDLVLPGDGESPVLLMRAQEADLPKASRLAYVDADTYEQAVAEARRPLAATERIAASSLPLVLEAPAASAIGERLLQDAWVMRETARFSLPPSLLALDPADEVVLAIGGRTHRWRIAGVEDGGARAVNAVATDPSLYDPLDGAPRAATAPAILRPPGRPLVVFLDLPLLRDDQNPNAPFAAAFADPWPGRVDLYQDYAGAPCVSLTAAASIGETLFNFWSGPVNRWDRVNSLYLKLYRGTLQSASDAAVFAGANALAIQNGSDWEIVQFAEAELIAPGQWRLSKLLRGRQGSEQAMGAPVAAGARVVVLDGALRQVPLSQAEARLPHHFTYGPGGKPVSDASFTTVECRFTAAGLIPPSPCHVGFRWRANGDLLLTWKRRDRAPAAAQLLLAETPQSDAGLFDLEILADGAVVRCFSNVPQNSQVYAAAEQAADFPQGMPNPLIVRVFQRSSVVGRGRPKTEPLYVR
jgi:hypothetical protein